MTEQSVVIIVTSVVGGVTTLGLAWIASKQAQLKDRLTEMSNVLDTTHSLVNSAMGIQLAMHQETTRHFAEVVPTPFNIDAASRAKKAYDEHKAKQALADARSRTAANK